MREHANNDTIFKLQYVKIDTGKNDILFLICIVFKLQYVKIDTYNALLTFIITERFKLQYVKIDTSLLI